MSVSKTLQNSPTDYFIPDSNNPPMGTVTSSFFVSMDEIFSTSNVGSGSSKQASKLAKAVQLLWYTSIEERPSIGTMTSNFQASATLNHSLLVMHVMTDSAMPTLRQYLRSNQCIKEIHITRVGHLGEDKDNMIMYQTTFKNCFLECMEEFPDKLILKARVTIRSDAATVTDFTGTQKGSTASSWDYSQNAKGP